MYYEYQCISRREQVNSLAYVGSAAEQYWEGQAWDEDAVGQVSRMRLLRLEDRKRIRLVAIGECLQKSWLVAAACCFGEVDCHHEDSQLKTCDQGLLWTASTTFAAAAK